MAASENRRESKRNAARSEDAKKYETQGPDRFRQPKSANYFLHPGSTGSKPLDGALRSAISKACSTASALQGFFDAVPAAPQGRKTEALPSVNDDE